jgi:hypothetical protein
MMILAFSPDALAVSSDVSTIARHSNKGSPVARKHEEGMDLVDKQTSPADTPTDLTVMKRATLRLQVRIFGSRTHACIA